MSRWREAHAWRREPPPWWPRDEPWPARGRSALRDARRARFVRRTGWFSFLPLWAFLWFVGTRLQWGAGGIELLLLCAVAAGAFSMAARRMAAPVADIVSAADRIARRDYRVRVDVPQFGPRWLGDTARAFNAMARELDAQDTARRQLMADVAHELRTPLAVVQGTLEGLIDGVYPRDDVRLQGLLDDTRVLARLIDDLRTLSTAEGGALALSKEPVDILALASDVVSSLEARARDAGVTLRAESAPGEIEPIVIDPIRVREVLMNLVANALHYTPHGGEVRVVIHPQPQGVEVRVIDTGAGISAEELPHIFDRFYKGSGSSGSGLGLTIARSLVEAHGGTIRAESRIGAGTTMVVVLPR